MKKFIQCATLALIATAWAAVLTYSQDAPKPAPKMKADVTTAGVKGKLPTGWSTTLKLSSFQKDEMYKVSSTFQAKIADLKDQEYRAIFKLLNDDQKALLKKKALGE